MTRRLYLASRILTFLAAAWIVGMVVWGLASGSSDITPPSVAVMLLVVGALLQLFLWMLAKLARDR